MSLFEICQRDVKGGSFMIIFKFMLIKTLIFVLLKERRGDPPDLIDVSHRTKDLIPESFHIFTKIFISSIFISVGADVFFPLKIRLLTQGAPLSAEENVGLLAILRQVAQADYVTYWDLESHHSPPARVCLHCIHCWV